MTNVCIYSLSNVYIYISIYIGTKSAFVFALLFKSIKAIQLPEIFKEMVDLCVVNENWLLQWKSNAQEDNEVQQSSFMLKDNNSVSPIIMSYPHYSQSVKSTLCRSISSPTSTISSFEVSLISISY